MAYRLHRIDGVTELPAWWNVGGTAFHRCIEEWETDHAATHPLGLVPAARSADDQAERFRHHLAEVTAETVLASGVSLSAWRVARGGKEDREWWLDNAPAWVANYVAAAMIRESRIETVGAVLGLEVEFMWRMPPGLPEVKGFVDQVHRFDNGDILIRDLKSGSSRPADSLQLKVYRLALEDEYGLTAPRWFGDYWQARRGEPTRSIDLTDRATVEREVFNRTAIMDSAERAGIYMPNPTHSCVSCGVRAACPVMGDPSTARPWSIAITPVPS